MKETLDILTDIVANKFTALLIVIIGLWITGRQLYANVTHRREEMQARIKELERRLQEREDGMEARIRALEEEVLACSSTEVAMVGIMHSQMALLTATGTGGERTAFVPMIDEIKNSINRVMEGIHARHQGLRMRYEVKDVVRERAS